MDEQQRDLEELLARANSLLEQYSVTGHRPFDARIERLSSLRDNLSEELASYRLRYVGERLKA